MSGLRTVAVLVCLAAMTGAAQQPARAGRAPTWRHEVLRSFPHDPEAFTQGLLFRDGFLYESTGRNGRSSLRKVELETGKVVQRLEGEGWGLAEDRDRLVMSDGTPELRFLNPQTLAETGRVRVLDGGTAVDDLNELEVVKGEIFANVWMTDRIAVIAPATGRVVAWLDLTGLMPTQADPDAVLNGIAYDAARDRLFVTGKLWPRMFEIRVIRR
jgi:glutamine cyclotransferase